LVSGLSPALVPAAALCRTARAARRAGALVVVDINARRPLWRGREPRTVQAILREADVVRCSTDDLVSLWIDPASVRAAMRESSTLVMTDGPGQAVASGPFGEIVVAPREVLPDTAVGAGDAFTAALCRGLLGAKGRFDWERALHEAHAAAHERIRLAPR
jgi:sugar/nucleoside kinase (ribokinase family)